MRLCTLARFAKTAVAAGCLLALAAFSVLSTEAQTSTGSPVNRVTTGSTVVLSEHTAHQVLDGTAIRIGHYAPEQMLRLTLAVRPPHMAEEEKFIEELQTKGSPNFHKFLTAAEWDARFAPSAEDEQKVVDWAKSEGLTVTHRFANRLLVDLEAPSGVIEKALGVTINSYKVGEETDFANDRDPSLPATLSGIVYSVQGLNNIERMHGSDPSSDLIKVPDYSPGPGLSKGESDKKDADPSKAQPSKADANGPIPNITNNELDPADIFSSQTYNYQGLYNLGHCCNPNHIAAGAPATSSIAISAFGNVLGSDIAGFAGAYGLAYNYSVWFIDGTISCPAGQTVCPSGETSQDAEWSMATANSRGAWQDTAQVIVYIGANGNNSTFTDMYNYMLSDNYARVFSTSWSCTEVYGCSTSVMDSRHAIFNSMVGQGWTLVAASGDRGASDDCNTSHIAVAYPASDPDFVAAGGTELGVYSDGTWKSEVAWGGGTYAGACAHNNGGSGGGISAYYGKPSWQNEFGGSYRLTPDLSLNALGVGQNVYINGSFGGDANGTSVSAPEWAGFFAQEDAYLIYEGNICGSGSSACAPIGNPNPFVFREGQYTNAQHYPFYDMTSGCNSNDITNAGGLGYYCAHSGYDLVTGWGSANMMQLAWAINWYLIPASGTPSVTYTGPATYTWYNTTQIVSWTINDYGGGTYPGTGIAGFTQGWDSIPSDSSSEPHGGTGDSYYSGPEFPNGTTGCLALGSSGCTNTEAQGCHTAHVRGWSNQGFTTGDVSYGPICYDTVAPTISISNSPATPASGFYKGSVVVTLTTSDPGGSGASGIYRTYYAIDTGACYPGNLGACNVYSGPFTVSAQGQHYIYYMTEDYAGNFSAEPYEWVSIDLTPPVTTDTLSGTVYSGTTYDSAVKVTLSATDNLSGPQYTYYEVNGGATILYSGPFNVSILGSDTVKFWSIDSAGNTEAAKVVPFSIVSKTTTAMTASPSSATVGQSVTMKATVTATLSGTPTGSVTFWNGATNLGTATLSGGIATLTTTALPDGALTLQASFLGSASFLSSNSVPFDVTVGKGTPGITLAAAPNPVTVGSSLAITATVAGPGGSVTPTGNVNFYVDNVGVGKVSVVAGKAVYSTSTLAVGTHTFVAQYNGDTNYSGVKAGAISATVKKATTSATLTSSANPAVFGASVTITATFASTISGTPPSGTIKFFTGTTLLGTGALSAGVATLTTNGMLVGTNDVTAHFVGDSDYSAYVSPTLVETVKKVTEPVKISALPSTANLGSPITVKVTVDTAANGILPTGTVRIYADYVLFGTFTMSGGDATTQISTLTAGSHVISAQYSGDTNYGGGNPTPTKVTVN